MLKKTLSFVAKALAITLALLTFGVVIISFIHPEWIEAAIIWMGELIKKL